MEFIRFNQLLKQKDAVIISPSLKLQNNEVLVEGLIPVISQGKQFIFGYTNDSDPKLLQPPYIVFGDHTEIIKFINFSFVQGADGIKIIKVNELFNSAPFIYYSLLCCYHRTGFYERHFKMLKKTYLPKLDLNHQIKIASILGNYDGLIQNNEKRIAVLESIVEQIYKEWFVRFRFPGSEKVGMIGGVPGNWSYSKFSDIYSSFRGVSYSSEEIDCCDGQNLINLKNINSYGGFRRDGTKQYNGKFKKEQVVNYKDLVMGVTDMTQERRTVGAVALIPNIKGIISADLIKLVSPINNIFSYCMFRFGSYSKLFSQFGNGANVIHLKPSSISNQKMLIPPENLIDQFVKIVEPMIDLVEMLNVENDNLLMQRDMLLPRLMSGELNVSGKEII